MNLKDMRSPPAGSYPNIARFGQPEYTGWIDESMSWKESCYIGDWSWIQERRLRGPDVEKLLASISVNSFAKVAIGQSKHLIHTNEAGKVIHEGILSRLDDQEYMLFGRGGYWADHMLRHGNFDVESIEDDWYNFQVSGPLAIHVVEKAAGQNMRDIKFMHSGEVMIAGCKVRALRQGMAGEIGYELQGPRAESLAIYNAILEAGKEFGIRRLGGRVSGVNHIEACFPTIIVDYLPAIFEPETTAYLKEFMAAMPTFATTFNVAGSYEGKSISDYYRSPVELGWGKTIKFDHDFIGRNALEEELAHPRRQIRTLVWNADDVTEVFASLFCKGTPYAVMDLPRDQRGYMWADKVTKNGNVVGVATSRGYSYYFREMLSLAVMDVDHAEIGTEVVVLWGEPGGPQKEVRAIIAPAPYKQDNRRADVTAV